MSDIHLKVNITVDNAEYSLEVYIYDAKEVEAWIYRKGYSIKYLVYQGVYTEPVSEEVVIDAIGLWMKHHNSIYEYENLIGLYNDLVKNKIGINKNKLNILSS